MTPLSFEDRGKIITWILEYVNDENPKPLNGLLAAVCEPIKQQLKRDLKKYEKRAESSRNNGKLGGRPNNLKEPRKPSGLNNNLAEPRKPVIDTVSVTDSVKVSVTDINKIKERKLKFAKRISDNNLDYNKEMLTEFYNYWTEKSPQGKKMRFELEKVFDVKLRLSVWLSRKNKNNYGKKTTIRATGNIGKDKEFGQF